MRALETAEGALAAAESQTAAARISITILTGKRRRWVDAVTAAMTELESGLEKAMTIDVARVGFFGAAIQVVCRSGSAGGSLGLSFEGQKKVMQNHNFVMQYLCLSSA